MDIVVDASAILAVLLNEPERKAIVEATMGHSLVAPSCIEHEIGNALSALLKRGCVDIPQAILVYHEFCKIPVRQIEAAIPSAILVAGEERVYAYDAYYICCAEQLRLPILTLDSKLAVVAEKRGLKLVEV